MMEDLDSVRYERDDYKRKMNMAGQTIKSQQEIIDNLTVQLNAAKVTIQSISRDRDTANNIMANSISENNIKVNAYIERIQSLRAELAGR